MTLKFLAGMLTDDTFVLVKDADGNIIECKRAADIKEEDPVLDWDFSKDHVIYIDTLKRVYRWHATGDM